MLKNVVVFGLFLVCFSQHAFAGEHVDEIKFGDLTSEHHHAFTQFRSEVINGGLNEPARLLLPLDPVSFNGGSVSFRMNVDSERQNYLTVKLWGTDKGEDRGRLLLFIDGLQVGYRHEGDYDVLNQADDDAIYPGRFLYETLPLPLAHTRGRHSVELKIMGIGPIWPYGTSFAQEQHTLIKPTRGIYRAYVDTDAKFEPDVDEQQGANTRPLVRPAGDLTLLLDQMKQTVNDRLTLLMAGHGASGDAAQSNMLLLAEAYGIPWTRAYQNKRAISEIVREGDEFLRSGRIDTGNWIGAGRFGEAVARLGDNPYFVKRLNELIQVPAQLPNNLIHVSDEQLPAYDSSADPVRMTRREAWASILQASVEIHRTKGRRFYTNQSMLVDYNIYTANRGLRILDPADAIPEKQAMRYVYEAIGLRPWLGNDKEEGGSEMPYGPNYFLITQKGLSRELGYVGTYGETILRFSHDIAEFTGDKQLLQQLIKIQDARLYFRYPSMDPDGYRVMKLVSEIDNRTAHYPAPNGDYDAADVRELWWMEVPSLTKDPAAVGAAQQSLHDHQYFYRLSQRKNDPDTLGMMRNIDEYADVKSLPESYFVIPTSYKAPDFVHADEQDAVVALKHGDDRLFVNFYYRQEFGVSGATRILDVSPDMMRIATVNAQFRVIPSGQEWTRPDVIDFERSGGFNPPGPSIHEAWAGEKLPVARRPKGATEPPYGTWGPFVGKAAFYWLRYGDYLFGLNTTQTETYSLPVPAKYAHEHLRDLVSGKLLDVGKGIRVSPLSTVVLYLTQEH